MRFTNLTRRLEIGANSYLLEVLDKKIVLDCGMHPKESGEHALPRFDLLGHETVDAIVLSHAHQDHVGTLPLLSRHQAHTPVFMTEATRRLGAIMLHNSVNVMDRQREEIGATQLFRHRDVELCCKRWRACPLEQRFSLKGERLGAHEDSLSLEFFDAGHILGSIGVMIRAEGKKIFYTGDVNFENQTIAQAATFPEEPVDVLIMETTRGDSPLPEGFTRQKEQARLLAAIQEALKRDGCILIPVFALGKTQELLAMLHLMRKNRELGTIPVYIGGLSTKITCLYDELRTSTPRQLPGLKLMDSPSLQTLSGQDAGSTELHDHRIYALSSGMMTENTLSNVFGRRVLNQADESIFFVGYADPDSPAGRVKAARPGDLIQLASELPPEPLGCNVESFNFSAHSSRETLRAYANKVRPKKILLVHGDEPAMAWFKQALQADLPDTEIISPAPGEPLEL
jgi:Cft2 family RNA processing exonuclease